MVANMVISYTAPSAQTWARREALAFCTVMAIIVASDAWMVLLLLTRAPTK